MDNRTSGMVSVIIFTFIVLFSQSKAQGNSCRDPGVIRNGFKVPKTLKTFPAGTVIHFFCNPGYNRSGVPKIECESDGRWSAKIPTCQGPCNNKCQNGGICGLDKSTHRPITRYRCICPLGFTGEFCERVVCLPPPTILHGSYNLISGTGNSYFRVYSTVQYYCKAGFRLQGQARISCNPDGQWSPKPPSCTVVTCKNRLNPPSYSLINGNYVPVKTMYDFDDVVTFTCDKGYQLRGSSSSRCTEMGFWSTNVWPQCYEQKCPTIPEMKHGYTILQQDSRNIGTKVNYNCARGYYLYGQASQVCEVTINGKAAWSGRQPMCITRSLFEQYCAVLSKVMVMDPEARCAAKDVKQTVIRTPSMDTMTIVTGTAGGILGFLLVIIAIVACQRRRLYRRMRLATSRRPRSWSSEEDRMAFICYSNDVRLFLPSYDEAMRTRPPEPPPFEAVVADGGRTRAASTAGNSAATRENGTQSAVPENSESEENPYETIDPLPVSPVLQTSINEPIYAAVQRVLSPFTRTGHRLSSSSQGEATSQAAATITEVAEEGTEVFPSEGNEAPAPAESENGAVAGAEGSSPPDTGAGGGAKSGKKKGSKKDRKDKKNKKKGESRWQLSVTKSEETAATAESKHEGPEQEARIASLNSSSENITDDDENRPLIE